MGQGNKRLLTPIEITALLIGIMADINSASAPNGVVNIAKQDGWISAALGVIYPLYVAFIAIYISGRFPKDNILILSKKYFGNPIGTLANFLFFLSFFSYFPSVSSTTLDVSRTYVVGFLTPVKIYIVMMLLGAYSAYKGIKVLARVCVLNIIAFVAIIALSFMILMYGSLINIMPIFGSGFMNIAEGAVSTIYDYAAIEIIFLLYPLINDSKKIKSSILSAVGFICFMYTWIVFITIYCLGIDIIPKTIWSFFSATESIKIEALHNFRFLYIFLWILTAFKTIALLYYVCIFILQEIHKAMANKITYGLLGIAVIFITITFLPDRLSREAIVSYTTKFSVGFNLLYITIIAVIIFIKKDGKSAIK